MTKRGISFMDVGRARERVSKQPAGYFKIYESSYPPSW